MTEAEMPHFQALLDEDHAEIGACFRLLSIAFRVSPDSPEAASLMGIVRARQLGVAWPFGEETRLDAINARMAENLEPQGLGDAYRRLFVGPDAFEAPPWGSVYLDRESVLFGESTLDLRAFLAKEGVALDTGLNEPEDHIGLVLWLVADFLSAGKTDAAAELLERHILPWSRRYLELLAAHAGHPFYEGLASLAAMTLAGLATKMGISPVARALYR